MKTPVTVEVEVEVEIPNTVEVEVGGKVGGELSPSASLCTVPPLSGRDIVVVMAAMEVEGLMMGRVLVVVSKATARALRVGLVVVTAA